MIANKSLETFFEENFGNDIQPFLLYKDKQLLKEKNYKEFAEEQIKKTGRIYVSFLFALVYGAFYSIINLIEYGRTQENFPLIIGSLAFIVMILSVFYSTKKYYTIKSSMKIFLKLLEENSD